MLEETGSQVVSIATIVYNLKCRVYDLSTTSERVDRPLSVVESSFQAEKHLTMGLMPFNVPLLDQYDPMVLGTAYVSGIEGVPWAGHILSTDSGFSIERAIDESGRLSIVWPNSEYGASVLTTASLRCQSEPYWLPVELARGTLHRVRNRAFEWQRLGLKIPESFGVSIDAAVANFIDAIMLQQSSPYMACEKAQASIDAAMSASRPLCRSFISQAIQFRLQQEKQLSTLLGLRLDDGPHWRTDAMTAREAFNTAAIAPSWHQIEADTQRVDYEVFDEQIKWAKSQGMRIVGGPLVSLQPHAIQNWMYMLHDFDSFYQGACQFVQRTVERYCGQVSIWNVGAGLNSPNELGLTDEQTLRLAVGIVQAARRADPRTPVLITIDMPWAEYLGQRVNAISPLHFSDALLRADLGLSGIGLEMNFNHYPGGSLPRDLIDVSDLIDQWAVLGVPLVVSVTTTHCFEEDTGAYSKYAMVSDWKLPSSRIDTQSSLSATYALEIVQMLLAKQNVHGIFWNQHSDRNKHIYSNAGLIDSNGNPRPLLDGLTQLRSRHGQ